ncbi:Claudin-23, partial [Chlamydotis macqueenii]
PGMRTPPAMIVGMVLCPCGLLLTLTGTLAPNWRKLGYFEQVPVRVAQGLMPTSLVVALLGLVVATLGVRCWHKEPRHVLAGVAGLVLLLSGLLSLVPASWYTHELWALPAPAGSTLAVGYSLVLSYLGSCLEILGGLALALSFHHCCKEC